MNDSLSNAKTIQIKAIRATIDNGILLAGRYQIVRKLGEGGMGTVWLAEDAKLDARQVAIKMLPVVLITDNRAIKQLKGEAKLAIQLAHPNIATIRAFEESNEGPFLVMDYIPGNTLNDRLANCETLSEDEIIRLFTPIAQALDYAHSQNVIHRDIKPSNILIREDGTPFLTDFGIAREMKETMTRVTSCNTSGTLSYMSPEQLRGLDPTPAQDIYSLAATIYEALMGNPPFHRGQIEYQIINETPPFITTVNDQLATAIFSGLQKNAKERPVSCCQLLYSAPSKLPKLKSKARSDARKMGFVDFLFILVIWLLVYFVGSLLMQFTISDLNLFNVVFSWILFPCVSVILTSYLIAARMVKWEVAP